MSTSSIPAAIDNLLALITGLPVISTYSVGVYDGYPVYEDDNLITVGGTGENDATGDQKPAAISYGQPFREEDYVIQVTISSIVGGLNMKAARDICFAIFAAIETALHADPTLDGAVRWAQTEGVEYEQTGDNDASGGRRAQVTLGVHCANRILPA